MVSKVLMFAIFTSFTAIFLYILSAYFQNSSIALNLIFTLVGAFLTLGIFTIAYFQFRLTNTPFCEGRLVKNSVSNYFDLHLFNSGPGLAREITWLLKVEDLPVNYLTCSILNGIRCSEIDDFSSFEGTLQALSQNTGSLNVKGVIPASCKGKDHYYTVFMRYSRLIWVLKRFKYCQIRFSSEGKRLDITYEISASEFKAEIKNTSNFSQKLGEISRNPSKASVPLGP